MTVDVIMPSYNSIATINYALASIAAQRLDEGDSFKVTVVDDCSTDGVDYQTVVDYWAAFMPIELIEKDVNEGCGQARQTGMDNTDGDYFMFVDTDDALIGPYAIRYLLRAIEDNDVVMGQFAEETATGIQLHGENWTWCHAKLYRRSFVERHLIRFNMTRHNEDSGFNQIISHISDRTIYIPQIIYSWNNNMSSTVRSDATGYRCGYGWRDFLENLAWACEELQKRNVNKAVIRDFAIECASTLYFQYADAQRYKSEEDAENRKKLQDFYKRALRPYVLDGAVAYEHLTTQFLKHQKDIPIISIPQVTFKEYIRILGYFDDMKRLYSQTEK